MLFFWGWHCITWMPHNSVPAILEPTLSESLLKMPLTCALYPLPFSLIQYMSLYYYAEVLETTTRSGQCYHTMMKRTHICVAYSHSLLCCILSMHQMNPLHCIQFTLIANTIQPIPLQIWDCILDFSLLKIKPNQYLQPQITTTIWWREC